MYQTRFGKQRSLQAGGLTAGGSLGGTYDCLILAHAAWGSDHQDYLKLKSPNTLRYCVFENEISEPSGRIL